MYNTNQMNLTYIQQYINYIFYYRMNIIQNIVSINQIIIESELRQRDIQYEVELNQNE